MTKYINADEFLNLFHAVMESKGLSETDSWFCYRDLERVISATQSADVVEVVRCKDCKDYDGCKYLHEVGITVNDSYRLGLFITDDDFCSYGRKKEE